MPRPHAPQPGRPAESGQEFDPSALSMPVAAKVLGLPEATLHKHAEEGLPLNADGTLNLVTYAAWLNGTDETDDGD